MLFGFAPGLLGEREVLGLWAGTGGQAGVGITEDGDGVLSALQAMANWGCSDSTYSMLPTSSSDCWLCGNG